VNHTALLTWNDPSDPEYQGRAVWNLPGGADPANINLAQEDDGLSIGDHQSIYPDELTAVEQGVTPISFDGLEDVAISDIEPGDIVVVVDGDVTVEFVASSGALDDAAGEEPAVYALGFIFDGSKAFRRRS